MRPRVGGADKIVDLRPREWAALTFYDPEVVLRELRTLEIALAPVEMSEAVRRLRTGRLKGDREARDAALFAHGMAQVAKTKVRVSPGETADADFITCVHVGNETIFTPVQLKELPPEDRSANADLHALLASLADRPQSDAVLAVRLNRRRCFELSELTDVVVPFAELWFFWSANPDATEWCLFGNAMANPTLYKYSYPT